MNTVFIIFLQLQATVQPFTGPASPLAEKQTEKQAARDQHFHGAAFKY